MNNGRSAELSLEGESLKIAGYERIFKLAPDMMCIADLQGG